MKHRNTYPSLLLTLALAIMPLTGQAAAKGETLAKAKGCMACHSVDKKIVGPAYKEVAKKYKGDAKATTQLHDKVRKGGKGVWGQIPMPPQTAVSDADLKTIIAWILAH